MGLPLFQTGFWTHRNYLQDSTATSRDGLNSTYQSLNNTLSKQRILDESRGLVKIPDADTTSTYSRMLSNLVSVGKGETVLFDGSNYRTSWLDSKLGLSIVDSILTSLGSTNGVELHYNMAYSNANSYDGIVFTYNGKVYYLGESASVNSGLKLFNHTDDPTHVTNLLTRDNVSCIDYSAPSVWTEVKVRLFTYANTLYVKIARKFGSTVTLGYYSVNSGSNAISNVTFKGGFSGGLIDNFSVYRINSTEAGAYSTTNTVNDFDSFQRILFAFKDYFTLTGGLGWTGSASTPGADMTDGDDATYATANSTPIGFQLTSGTIGQYIQRWLSRTPDNTNGSSISATSSIPAIETYLHKVSESGTTTWKSSASGGASPQEASTTIPGVITDTGVPIMITNNTTTGILPTTTTPSFTIQLV